MTQSEIVELFKKLSSADWLEPKLAGEGNAAIQAIALILSTVSENVKDKVELGFEEVAVLAGNEAWIDVLLSGFFGPRLTGETSAEYRQRKTNAVASITRPNLETIAHSILDPLLTTFQFVEGMTTFGMCSDSTDTEVHPHLLTGGAPTVPLSATDASQVTYGAEGFRNALFLILSQLLSSANLDRIFTAIKQAKAGGVNLQMFTGPLDAAAALPAGSYGEGAYGDGAYGQ